MTELPLVFVGGLLGSAHCVGMCGGFALTLGTAAPTWQANFVRQALFGFGRTFTYMALGAVAGFGGQRLVELAPLGRMQSWLALVAGILLIWQGLAATGLLPRRKTVSGKAACLRPGLLPTLLRTRGGVAAVASGVVTGLLPCGFVYAFLALAVSGGTMWSGMATMVCFGLGTLPLLTLFGLGTSLVGFSFRQRMMQAAAWCIVLTGALSVVRGAGVLTTPVPSDHPPACPFCSTRADETGSRSENKAAAATMPIDDKTTISNATP
jgi:sulfite exporter TauE/SafE